MPNTGTCATSSRTSATQSGSAAGSPGPLPSSTPSGSTASTCSAVASQGNTVTRAPGLAEDAHDRPLHPVVEHGDVCPLRQPIASSRSGSVQETPPASAWPAISGSARAIASSLGGRRAVVGDRRAHRAAVAQPAGQHPRVQPLDADHAVAGEPVGEALAPVGAGVAALADDDRPGVRPGRLGRVLLDPVVADHRLGEGDHLPGERGVGDDLLVAGHRGDEHQLADRRAGGAVGGALQHRAVLEDEHRAAHSAASTSRWATDPPATVSVQTPCSVCPSHQQLRERDA